DLSKYSKAVFQKSDTADACEGINGKASFQGQQGFFEKEQTQSLHHTSTHYDATQQQFSVKVVGFYFHNPPIIQERASGRTFGLQKLLNLGCGNRYHPDWVNVDVRSNGNGVISHDLKKPMPFDDASFVAVYHSHLLEHFPKEYAPIFLRECFRVLKPGGIIRVAVPDLEQIARLYLQCLDRALQGDEAAQKRYEWIVLELFDQMVRTRPGGAMFEYWQRQPMPAEDFVLERMGSQVRTFLKGMRQQKENSSGKGHGLHQAAELTADEIGRFRLSGEVHQWMYDRYSLGKLLRDSGFEDVRVCRADESAIPDFNTYLLDIEADGSVRKPDSLFMEGRKPAAVTTRKEHNTCVGIENRGENVLSFL
ncbi:MAG: methyltransferase domain-containing protein, partial [Desulfobacterota bacterium]|nr:methyltransferase domain-containing protein [Thermodesulfobacteriota bacterium]